MTQKKFTLAQAINEATNIQIQGVKIGAHQVLLDISKRKAHAVVPSVLLEEEWYEFTEGCGRVDDYEFHCPETGMIFAIYYKGIENACLTINHNAI